jgi:hypothetical protein
MIITVSLIDAVCKSHGDALSPLFFNFALEYAIRKAQENQVGLKLNGTHQPLAYVDDMNLLGDNIETKKRNRGTLIDASKKVGLEVIVERTKYMLVCRSKWRHKNRHELNKTRSVKVQAAVIILNI